VGARAGLALVGAVVVLASQAGTATAHSSGPVVTGAAHDPGVTQKCPKVDETVNHDAPGSGKTVALTFDDGPGASTQQILDILMRYGVRATFFNIGEWLPRYPDLVAEELADGQTLGNHTWDHHDLVPLSSQQQAAEIDRTTNAQLRLTGTRPCLFRPPGGGYDRSTLKLAQSRHYSLWLWSVDTEDWKAAGSASRHWVNRVRTRAEAGGSQPHPVVLMHNEAGLPDAATVAALPSIIRYYQSHGYNFVDLFGQRGLTPSAPTGGNVPAVAATQNGRRLFSLDSDGHVTMSKASNGQWSDPTSLGATAVAGPAVASLTPTTLLLAVTDVEGHVLVRALTDNAPTPGWRLIAGRVAGRPALAVDPVNGEVVLAARRTDGSVAIKVRSGHGRWSDWRSLGDGFVGDPALTATPDGRLTVVALRPDGQLASSHFNGATWSPWHSVTDEATGDPALVTSNDGKHLVLIARSSTGVMRVRVGDSTGTTWHAWHSLGATIMSSGSSAVAVGDQILTVARRTDQQVLLGAISDVGAGLDFHGWRRLPLAEHRVRTTRIGLPPPGEVPEVDH
jgi:peptidoglycan/xylan/chitin deacetylase (PgdA/CDA1 family)